jgi:hypothetical protein
MNATTMAIVALGISATMAGPACAQGGTLDRRVAAVTDGTVQFHFAAREDVCGDGEHWYRVGEDSWHGSYINTGDPAFRAACVRGPVRVRLTIAAREVVRVETFVGPLGSSPGATDLGPVNAREASAWLLGIAARGEGRPARDALAPALLADSAAPTPALLAIARDRDRPRDTRRSAIGWLARASEAPTAEVSRALTAIARDDREPPPLRQQAVSTLARLPQGTGFAALSALAGDRGDLAIAREATKVLARSGDPRARDHLRRAVTDDGLPEELRAAAISGLGNDMATGADSRLLRESYGSLRGPTAKEAVISAVAAVGGAPNVNWLLGIARDRDEAAALRLRAISQSPRAGATGHQLVALFDEVEDTDAKGAVISALAQEGSRPAREKLVTIAQSSELASLRRRAISAMERLDGPEVREALAGIAVRPETE